MAGHGSAPPPDRGSHPGRQVGRLPYGQGGPHPSLSDETVAAIEARSKAKVAGYINRRLTDTLTDDERAEQEYLRRSEYED